ncbi:hypothetical protein V1525DRAFT_403467 [Lipomyces kononenkoae]|uniref:Uncharacterized protein n=1 Tax=Lipomyces kononenkoae TaxID=34357 RepID=A0ACC3T241_LIPKO
MSSFARRRRPALLPCTSDSKTLRSSSSPRQKSSTASQPVTDRTMPAKKAARSRNGCWTCRNRKVKCDEAHPKCTPCSRLGEVCDYTRQVSYKDDTPKIVRKLAKLTDTAGCPVYDPTVRQIFHPYPHLGQDCEDGKNMDFVVIFASDYADPGSRSPMEDSCISPVHRRGSASSCSSSSSRSNEDEDEDDDDDDEDDDEEDDVDELCHRKARKSPIEYYNVIEGPSQRPSRLVESIVTDMAHTNFSFQMCADITRDSRRQPQTPPSYFSVSDRISQAEQNIDNILPLRDADAATWSFDPQSSHYYPVCTQEMSSSLSTRPSWSMSSSYLHDTDHQGSIIPMASGPTEIMPPPDMNINHMSILETPTAYLHHLQQPHHAHPQGGLYEQFKPELEGPDSRLEEEGNVLLYSGRPFPLNDGPANDLAAYHLHKSQDNSAPITYTTLDHYWQPQFLLHSGVDSTVLTMEN